MPFNTLPCEVKELIFSFLNPEDLFHCLGVCQEWREIANSERLWKKTLIKSHIDISSFDEDTFQESLVCKYALLWKQHSDTCTGWSLNTFRQSYHPYDTSEELTCYRIFVFKDKMALISNKIQVFSFTHNTVSKESISLSFVPHAVRMNNKYLVCTVGNIVLIYKKEKIFKKYCALALPPFSPLIIQTQKLKAFVESKKKCGPYIKTEALVGEYLWISCEQEYERCLNVVNLKNLTLKNTKLNPILILSSKNKVFVSTREYIHIFNSEGDIQFSLRPDPGFKSFRATDHYIATFVSSGNRASIWTVDGKFLWQMEDNCFHFQLDPTRHLLYSCLQTNPCKLIAHSLETGCITWYDFLPDIRTSDVDDMFLVCDKFLIIDVYIDSPCPVSHFGFVYDLDSKTLLYKTVLQGCTMHISNNLWVQKRQNDVIVNVY